jgi:hypothetical protein
MRKLLPIIIFLLILAAASAAQNVKRIEFAKGAVSAVVKGFLRDYESRQTFLIRVREGQTLRVEQIKPDESLKYVTVAVKSLSGEYVGDSDASCNNRKEISPTVAGDYLIEVVECRKADPWRGKFKLKVSVE